MALNLIDHAPVIDQDHPLFSWDDFPQSRDSLVSGTPVSLFETDCWDAMVWKVDYIANMMDFSFSGLPYFSEKWNTFWQKSGSFFNKNKDLPLLWWWIGCFLL